MYAITYETRVQNTLFACDPMTWKVHVELQTVVHTKLLRIFLQLLQVLKYQFLVEFVKLVSQLISVVYL